jgi:hypothetical protein
MACPMGLVSIDPYDSTSVKGLAFANDQAKREIPAINPQANAVDNNALRGISDPVGAQRAGHD